MQADYFELVRDTGTIPEEITVVYKKKNYSIYTDSGTTFSLKMSNAINALCKTSDVWSEYLPMLIFPVKELDASYESLAIAFYIPKEKKDGAHVYSFLAAVRGKSVALKDIFLDRSLGTPSITIVTEKGFSENCSFSYKKAEGGILRFSAESLPNQFVYLRHQPAPENVTEIVSVVREAPPVPVTDIPDLSKMRLTDASLDTLKEYRDRLSAYITLRQNTEMVDYVLSSYREDEVIYRIAAVAKSMISKVSIDLVNKTSLDDIDSLVLVVYDLLPKELKGD